MPVRDKQGKVVQWIGTCTDIEQQKRAESALARLNEERAAIIEEVSTPIVPVWRGVLVLPIIGSLDTERMQRATQTALDEVMRSGARACIIDITGARIVDTQAVANLTSLVMALRLIGAQAIVTGIKAEAAQSLVGLGVEFSNMRTHRTLAEALASLINEHEVKRDGISHNGTGKDFRLIKRERLSHHTCQGRDAAQSGQKAARGRATLSGHSGLRRDCRPADCQRNPGAS